MKTDLEALVPGRRYRVSFDDIAWGGFTAAFVAWEPDLAHANGHVPRRGSVEQRRPPGHRGPGMVGRSHPDEPDAQAA